MTSSKSTTTLIDLPGKYLLTESGVRYFIRRQIPMHEIRTRRGTIANGVVWRRYDSAHVRKMVAYELLREIEIQRTEFLTRRSDIMQLTVRTLDGILEKRFRPELKQIIRDSVVFQPLYDRVAHTAPEQIRAHLLRNERAVNAVRSSLLVETIGIVEKDAALELSERQERVENIHRLVDAIDSETWFLLSLLPDTSGRTQLLRDIHALILTYNVRLRIGDYLALILLELLEYAEQTQLLNFAERDQYVRTHPGELANRLADPEFRERLFRRAAASNSLLSLNYRFSGNPYSPTRRPELEIAVSNKGLVGYESRKSILDVKHRKVHNVPLAKFYGTESPSRFDTTLGMYYLSYVESACERVGLRFGANMTRDEKNEETTTTLYLAF